MYVTLYTIFKTTSTNIVFKITERSSLRISSSYCLISTKLFPVIELSTKYIALCSNRCVPI